MPDNAIWAVTGPEHDARMARELAWIATGGQTGVVGPWSLEVMAQSTPNNTVRIMPGGFSIAATSQFAAIGYTSSPWNSYMRAIYQPVDVEIEQTGSSGGRTDVVGIVIDDPEFEGTSPDVDTHPYWRPHVARNAGNNATRPEHFASLGRPFLPLAQVRIPSSTATITNSMIHDIRFLAVSRRETEPAYMTSTSTVEVTSDSYTTVGTLTGIRVPQWATGAHITGSLSGMRVYGDGRCYGRVRGILNPSLGRREGHQTFFREDANAGVYQPRMHLPIHGTTPVYASERGTTVDFSFQARVTTGPGYLVAGETYTRFDLDVTFTEEPVRSWQE